MTYPTPSLPLVLWQAHTALPTLDALANLLDVEGQALTDPGPLQLLQNLDPAKLAATLRALAMYAKGDAQ